MNAIGFAAVAIGGALGSLLRWLFSFSWNAIWPELPLGTLASNMVGGYLVGIAVAFFTSNPDIPPEWRLFIITGCLGGLTTFSSFSAEAVGLFSSGHYGAGLIHTLTHLLGSFALTALGIATYKALA
jgi:CrcB protein